MTNGRADLDVESADTIFQEQIAECAHVFTPLHWRWQILTRLLNFTAVDWGWSHRVLLALSSLVTIPTLPERW